MVWVLTYPYIVPREVTITPHLDFPDATTTGGGYVGIEVVTVVVCTG